MYIRGGGGLIIKSSGIINKNNFFPWYCRNKSYTWKPALDNFWKKTQIKMNNEWENNNINEETKHL